MTMLTGDRVKKLLLLASAFAAGGFVFAVTNDYGWLKSLLWGLGSGIVGTAVLWLAGVGASAPHRRDSSGQ
jgi:Na+-transporting NADH:ubiquinone oxidoreductase subunit NqrE